MLDSQKLSKGDYLSYLRSPELEQQVIEKFEFNKEKPDFNIENLDKILSIKTEEESNKVKLTLTNTKPELARGLLDYWIEGFNIQVQQYISLYNMEYLNKLETQYDEYDKPIISHLGKDENDQIEQERIKIPNINIPKQIEEKEHFYHTIFYLTGVLFSDNNLRVYSKLLTSEGRIDMVVETDQNIFIIEFKCNQVARHAIRQIKEKNYGDRFQINEKKTVLIGINFDTEKRNVGEYIIDNSDEIR